ncbi:MAG: usg protein [Alphaproteobacteria bacterium]|nr:usg protein [Alphaproteobacteria bacterium]
MANTASPDFIRQLEGYGLTTAKIIYRLPDFRNVLQEFVWQEYDLAPKFPRLLKFLGFWQSTLEGPLHSVEVAHQGLIKPAELKLVGAEFRLH